MRAGWLLALAALGLVALGGGAYAGIKMTKGIRNKNPGNIRGAAQKWQGQVAVDGDGFAIFDTPENGLRALALLLKNYRDKYALRTITGIISRWAPPTENDTQSYIRSVSNRVGFAPDAILPATPEVYALLVRAIVRHENGVDPYTSEQVAAGLARAGVA